jgi:hypothetical protein
LNRQDTGLLGIDQDMIELTESADWTKTWQPTQPITVLQLLELSAGFTDLSGLEFNYAKPISLQGALEQRQIENEDGTLLITQVGDNYRWFEVRNNGKEPIYTLEIADLRHMAHRGHGKINVSPFTVNELEIKTSDHAKTSLASINAQSLTISASNHAHIKIETLDSDKVDFTTSGHADLYIQDSKVFDATIAASSHSQIWVAGHADSLRAGLRDHADLDSGDVKAAVSTVCVRSLKSRSPCERRGTH